MSGYRSSYGDVMTAMIRQHGRGKSQDFFLDTCRGDRQESEYVLECEINAMSNAELLDLMEQSGIVRVGDAQ